jgi:hypothetical protein
LNCRAVSLFSPLHERAIAEAYGSLSIDPGDLIARSPERTVTYADHSLIAGTDLDHGRITAVKRGELSVRNEKSVGRALLYHDSAIAIVGSDAQEVAVAVPSICFYESVSDTVTETEGTISALASRRLVLLERI